MPFLQAEGGDPPAPLGQVTASPGSQFFAIDVLVSGLVHALWIVSGRRPVTKTRRFACLVGLGTVGVSFALSLFLAFCAEAAGQGEVA